MKTKPHIFVLLAVLMCLGAIIPPCSAYYSPMTIQASDSNLGIVKHQFNNVQSINYGNGSDVISTIEMKYNIGTSVNFTLIYGDGQTVSGYSLYQSVVPFSLSRRTISIGSDTSSQDFIDLLQLGQDREIISYASNMTDAGAVISQGFMIHNPGLIGGQNILAYTPVGNGSFASSLITSVTITSDQPINVLILSDTAENTAKNADFTKVSLLDTGLQWVNFAIGIGAQVLDFAWLLIGLIRFFFIDYLWLTIGLYLGITMAVSFGTSSNIWQAYNKFFRYQRAVLNFMMEMWNYLIQIISAFRGIFRI